MIEVIVGAPVLTGQFVTVHGARRLDRSDRKLLRSAGSTFSARRRPRQQFGEHGSREPKRRKNIMLSDRRRRSEFRAQGLTHSHFSIRAHEANDRFGPHFNRDYVLMGALIHR
jgi:hypothetical protein